MSVEEGLVRSKAADAAGDENNALYDKTLSRSSGAGLLFNQTIRRMSHAVMRGSSVIRFLRRLLDTPSPSPAGPVAFSPVLLHSARAPSLLLAYPTYSLSRGRFITIFKG